MPELVGDHAGQQDDDHGGGGDEVAGHRLARCHRGQDQRAGPRSQHAEQVPAGGHPDLDASHLVAPSGWLDLEMAEQGHWRAGGSLSLRSPRRPAPVIGRPLTTIHCRVGPSQPPNPANISGKDCRFPATTYPEGQTGEPPRQPPTCR